ncbi:hypothetical protein [Gallaecimonas pentaromativorans]|uniref:hypothetical protein n=1 Tax=Gallaecimonas pentaromativorans TaxID=584787 RepID=UPI00067E7E43|nr:hypothetical protein [Gallaecimonas pentaromativorans]
MPWQLSLSGELAGVSAEALLAGMAPMPEDAPAPTAPEALLCADKPNWYLLAYGDQRPVPPQAQLARGRAGLALVLSQLQKSGEGARVIAPHRQGVLALDITPAAEGIVCRELLMDGRWDANPDFGPVLRRARQHCPQPAAVLMPGSGADNRLERLMPFFGEMAGWTGSDVPWQFAEAGMALETAGALFTWAWMAQGLAWGQWQGDAVVVELDDSPMMGLAVVRWQGSEG